MHIKLFLLWFPGFLRVVIPSANLVSFDWDSIENSVWLQDFPLMSSEQKEKTEFYKDLIHLLEKMDVPLQIRKALDGFDFTGAKVNILYFKYIY
jgi:hypothetical protein